MAASCGIEITPQGLDNRFTRATATFLEALLTAAIGAVSHADPAAVPLLQRFAGVYLQDCSALTLPAALAAVWTGCGDSTPAGHRSVVKVGVRLDLCRGSMQGPVLAPGKTHDRVVVQALPVLPPGSLRIADLGFFALAELATQAKRGCFWLTRVQTGTQVVDDAGTALPLSQFLAQQPGPVVDVPVRVGKAVRLPCRLLAAPAPAAVVAQRRERLKQDRHRRQQPMTQERLQLLEWTVLMTNLAPDQLTHSEAFVLYRARWQIELLFKLWKSTMAIDTWRTANHWRVLCEVYAKLIGCVVQHWLQLTATWEDPARSLVKASAVIRSFARQIAHALPRRRALCAVLADLAAVLRATGRVNTRRKRPSTAQFLLNPPLGALA